MSRLPKNTRNLDAVVDDTVEQDVALDRERPEPRAQVLAWPRGRDAINAAIRFILAMSLAAAAGSARAM
jgi:hypothetical protein